jgi:hypothetical protein
VKQADLCAVVDAEPVEIGPGLLDIGGAVAKQRFEVGDTGAQRIDVIERALRSRQRSHTTMIASSIIPDE